ncbi:MAG: hypothetical protein MJ230_00730, partial [bacterium]|nr:hypothetical protein [bacterium]
MKIEEPSQIFDDIDDIDDIDNFEFKNNISKSQSLNTTSDSIENKPHIPDIISKRDMPYFPCCYDAPLISIINKIYIETLDYMVGMERFQELFNELGVCSNNSNTIDRTNSIYRILNPDVLSMLSVLNIGEIYQVGDYTNRVESPLYTTTGFDVYVLKHLQQYHIKDMVSDIENNILHRFISLTYQKKNLIIHLYPLKCMELKHIPYEDALSYCISAMWATLINIVYTGMNSCTVEKDLIIDLLKKVFYQLNPILTKFVIYASRPITPEGYAFVYELQQLQPAKKHFTMKVSQNHVNYRWSPFNERFEDYFNNFYRTRFPIPEEEIGDLRGDSDGKRCCKYDCRIKNKSVIT